MSEIAAFVYDTHGQPGTYALDLKAFNARSPAKITTVYPYGGDLEVDANGQHCYYSAGVPASGAAGASTTLAYSRIVPRVMPIIDGNVNGPYLNGFNTMSAADARAFADLVAQTVCADPHADGVCFDLEPFDWSQVGQRSFYEHVIRNLTSHRFGAICDGRPQGMSVAIFCGPNVANNDGRELSGLLRLVKRGYLVVALYDLASAAAGVQTSVADYTRQAGHAVARVAKWAARYGIPVQFALPFAASVHEFVATSQGRATPVSSMTAYLAPALNSLKAIPATMPNRGIAIWGWTPKVQHGETEFYPATPDIDALDLLTVQGFLSQAP